VVQHFGDKSLLSQTLTQFLGPGVVASANLGQFPSPETTNQLPSLPDAVLDRDASLLSKFDRYDSATLVDKGMISKEINDELQARRDLRARWGAMLGVLCPDLSVDQVETVLDAHPQYPPPSDEFSLLTNVALEYGFLTVQGTLLSKYDPVVAFLFNRGIRAGQFQEAAQKLGIPRL